LPWALIFRALGAGSRLCTALKGHHIEAQGNALGQ